MCQSLAKVLIIKRLSYRYQKFLNFAHTYLQYVIGRIDKLMEGLKMKLKAAHEASGGRKVNIISHSMGGLLVLCFMSLHNDVCKFSLCDQFLSVT